VVADSESIGKTRRCTVREGKERQKSDVGFQCQETMERLVGAGTCANSASNNA